MGVSGGRTGVGGVKSLSRSPRIGPQCSRVLPDSGSNALAGSPWSRPPRASRLLTDAERRYRAVKEADFQEQVTGLAVVLGWSWCHWRALRNGRGIWQVPVEGPLGKGFPDLTLVRARDRRLVLAELKREDQDPSPDQVLVLELLRSAGVEAHLWRPSDLSDPIDLSRVYEVLR